MSKARHSVEFFGNPHNIFWYDNNIFLSLDILELADRNLKLRCVFDVLGYELRRKKPDLYEKYLYGKLLDIGWEIRLAELSIAHQVLIFDKSTIVSSILKDYEGNMSHFIYKDDNEVIRSCNNFDSFWSNSKPIEIIYEDPSLAIDTKPSNEIIITSNERWSKLIKYLADHPEHMLSLGSRQFEELIAELLVKDGMKVMLTGKTRDGGYDILARADTTVGEHLYLVECKRFSRSHPVGVEIVRSLRGVPEFQNATAGIIATTSRFSEDAIREHNDLRHRIYLKDYNDLVDWLRRHHSNS